MHVAWAGFPACTSGSGTCGEIYFTSVTGGTFADPMPASGGTDTSEVVPTLAFDPARNRILVGFHRFVPAGDDSYADVFLATKKRGDDFTEALDLTPGTSTSHEWFPSGLQASADGSIALTFEALENGSDPTNSDVYLTQFVPETSTTE